MNHGKSATYKSSDVVGWAYTNCVDYSWLLSNLFGNGDSIYYSFNYNCFSPNYSTFKTMLIRYCNCPIVSTLFYEKKLGYKSKGFYKAILKRIGKIDNFDKVKINLEKT